MHLRKHVAYCEHALPMDVHGVHVSGLALPRCAHSRLRGLGVKPRSSDKLACNLSGPALERTLDQDIGSCMQHASRCIVLVQCRFNIRIARTIPLDIAPVRRRLDNHTAAARI